MTHPDVLPWVGPDEAIPSSAARGLALVLWAIVLAYVAASRFKSHFTVFGHKIDLPGFRLAVAQVLLASVDVAVTAMIFYVLLPASPPGTPELTFLMFLGIYVAGYTAGLAASVPGGLGVFDGFMMLSLTPWVPAPQVVGAILLFRLFYYIVPLFLAGALFAGFEISQRRNMMRRMRTEARVADALEVPALSALVALAGATLLFIGALPQRGAGLAAWLGEWASLTSQFAASVVGTLLLVAAWGLLRRLRIAWWSSLALLINAAVILAVRADPWPVVLAVLVIAGFIAATRGAFYRNARLTSEPITASRVFYLAVVVFCGLALAAVAYNNHMPEASWWEVVLQVGAPAPLRFAVALSVLLLVAAAFRLLRPARLSAASYDAETRERLLALGARAPALPGDGVREDMGALFAEGGRAGFAFHRLDDVWVGLGDPAGEPAARIAAVWHFRDLCEQAGVEPAFADIGRGMQRVYEDAGLTPVTLPDGRTVVARAEGDPQRVIAILEG